MIYIPIKYAYIMYIPDKYMYIIYIYIDIAEVRL